MITNDHLNKKVDYDKTSSIQGLLRYDVIDDVSIDFRARYTDTKAGVAIYDLFAPVENLDQSYDDNLPNSNVLGVNDHLVKSGNPVPVLDPVKVAIKHERLS